MSDGLSDFGYSKHLQEQLLEFGELRQVEAGSTVLKKGAPIRSIPLVLKGSFKVMQVDEEGNEMLLYYIRPGESCIMSFLAGICMGVSSIQAVAEEDSEIFLVPVSKAAEWIREFPDWTTFVFKLYQHKFDELLNIIQLIAFEQIDVRLLKYLEDRSALLQNKELQITHEQIAHDLGTARVVVSRLLKQLEQKGRLQLGRNKVKLL